MIIQQIIEIFQRKFDLTVDLKKFDSPLRINLQIYRHGDRNIDKVYPNDPYKDEKYWPGGIGELTNVKMWHLVKFILN